MNSLQKFNISEALTLLDYYLLLIKKNNQNLIVSKNKSSIIIFNDNLKLSLSKDEFIKNFSGESFIIFKQLDNEVEINMEYKKIRQ